jgi:hypothetical protein
MATPDSLRSDPPPDIERDQIEAFLANLPEELRALIRAFEYDSVYPCGRDFRANRNVQWLRSRKVSPCALPNGGGI